MSFRRSSRPSFPQSHAVREACGPVVEALEQRRLLTTLFGGERAHYQDQAGNAIEIALNGSVTAEFVGSNVNDLNQIGLNDLPMTIVSSSNPARVGLRLNGGFAGRYGLQVIGTTPVNDSVNGLGNITGDAVNLSGLASNAAGATFALNVTTRVVDVLIRNPDSTTPPAEDTRVVNIVQLVQINNATGAGTVVFSIEAGLPSAPVVSADEEVLNSAGTALLRASRVSSIQAADFDAAGNLYFVATVEGGPIIDGAVVEGADTDVAVPQLFRVNVTTGVVTAIPGTFNLNIAGTTEEETLEIRSIAFDNNNNLIGYGLVGGSGQFFSIPTNNTNGVGGFTEVRYDRDGDGELDNITDITGIEIVPGDNTFIYAVSLNGETGLPVLLRIRRGTGGAIELGGLEPTTGDSGVPGNDLQGLAWNATLTDPFTGETGVLIATDATTDQLVYIDSRNRVPKSDLWNVYVASGGPSSGIAIAEIPFGSAEDADAVMTPYTGDSGTWRVTNNQSDYDLIDISAPLETGSAVLGTRSIVTVQETVDPFVPFIAAPLIDDIGLVTDNQFGNSLRPGLTTAANAGVDNFFFGGTVTGVVNQDAGMTTFYGGWIITGQTTGQTEFQPDPLITDNFRIRGTLRNLITPATVGSNSVQALDGLSYRSGFDMEVLGNVGWADVGGGFAGTINVQNRGDVPTFAGTRQRELEVRASSSSPGLQFRGNQFLNGTEFHNDSFDTAQRVGVMTSTDLEGQPGVQLLGTLVSSPTELDFRDWYAVTLEAGQTIRVKLTFLGLGTPPQVGLFRPDGVLVATDYSNQLSVTNQEFQYTTDRAGVWRVAVTMAEDPDFVNGGEFEEANPALPKPYELRVRDVGNVAFGVLDIAEDYWDGGAETSINVGVGDWGAMIVGETYVSGSAQSFVVDQDLRVLEAESIGRLTASSSNSTVTFGLGVAPVVGGDVHRLRATGSAGLLSVNDIYIGSPFPPPAIGGNYVEIDGEGQVFGYLYANEGIGALRAGRMTTFAPSKLVVNHDASGFDGIIDLIDVEGDFGSISAGGPQITTNAGGNVRFLRVEGDVYRDALFGGGSSEETNFSVGVAATITDDSGSVVTLQPVGTPNPLYNPADPLSVEPEFIGGLSPQIISLLTYGIRGSGGSAIIDIQTTGSVTISARGSARSARAEIGRIEVRGLGAEVLDIADIETETDTAGNPTTVVPQPDATTGSTLVLDPDGETLEVVINDGGADIDVLNVVVVANDGDGSVLSNLTRLRNNTKGSIASVIAKTIGTIDSDGSVGVVDGHVPGTIRAREELRLTPSFPTPRDPRPNNPGVTTLAYTPGDGEAMSTGGAVFVGDIYPFAGQTTGIVANGNIGSIRSNRAIGNVIANGSIGAIRANADGRDVANLFEGISGPIVAEDYSPARFGLQGSETAGRMFYVDIGEGILSAGTGGTASSGLYAADRISTVVNQGEGSDIRGEVVSRSAIGNITLTNGALINADVLVAGSFDFAREFVEGNAAASPSDPLDAPIYEIEKVLTTGSGGIIGTYISAPDIGDIVSTGFGILSTSIVPVGGAKVVNSVRGSGYGIRAVTIEGGASLNELIASGNGQNISTAVYTPSVRISETNLRYDPFTGFASSAATDLHAVLSTSAATPIIEGVTNSGVIEDVVASGQRDLGRVEGWQIRATNPVFVPTTFNFANSIGSIVSRSLINGLAIVTGRFKKFELNTDSFNTRITIAGPIDKVRVRGNFSNSSSINAVGPNGKIKDIDVTGNFDGAISATGSVDKINIGQNFTGTIFISGRGKQALRTFKLGGSLDGSLEIIGSVGTINAAQSFGNSGDSFVITGNLKKLLVGTNTSLNGASLGLNLTVTNNVDEITVTGSLDGTINVGGRLKKLRVIADDASPASIVNGAINVGGRIDSIDVRNRNVGASIAAAQDIKKVRFLNSSLLSGALISSTGEDIDDFKITNGSLLGSVNAAGRIKKLDVAGNLGDGTSFASVGAFTIGTLKIGGSILNGYTVSVPSKIGTLQIGGNVDAGATVSAGSISKKQISGVVNGTVTP